MHTPNKEESIFPIGNHRLPQDTQLLFQHPSHIPPIELPVHRLMHANYEHIGYQGRKITACPGTYTGSSEKGTMESEGKAGHDLHCTANFSKPRSPNLLCPLAKQSIMYTLGGKSLFLIWRIISKICYYGSHVPSLSKFVSALSNMQAFPCNPQHSCFPALMLRGWAGSCNGLLCSSTR